MVADLQRSGYRIDIHALPESSVDDMQRRAGLFGLIPRNDSLLFEVDINGQSIGRVGVHPGSPLPQQIEWIADQISTAMAENMRVDGKSVTWPPCPDGNMPMKPNIIAGEAVWVSPYPGSTMAPVPVGHWGSPS
ncbi:hypothetical protein C1S80_12875 [Mycolicibacterium aubagnense]|nr:hypothetical protein C1S80_12875 [Mycolicibacterium aubagnense]